MKKILSFLCIAAMMLSMTLTAFAGDIPESLLYEDGAQVFFAEVVETYQPNGDKPYVDVLPVKVIKGDVGVGKEQVIVCYNPNTIGDFDIKVGNVYLFTYLDENNPIDIFETTSQDTATLKLKHTTGDMWERFEEYLNEGRYEEAELKRVGKAQAVEKINKAKVLSELFMFDRNDVEKVEIVYSAEEETAGFYVDKDKFFDIAETVSLIPKNRMDEIESDNGVWIVVTDKNENRTSVWFDKKARVGCPQHTESSATTTQYEISRADYIKLYAFLPDEATAHIPLENPMKKHVAVGIAVAALVFVLAFVIGLRIKKTRG